MEGNKFDAEDKAALEAAVEGSAIFELEDFGGQESGEQVKSGGKQMKSGCCSIS